jgi:hypothetical protein
MQYCIIRCVLLVNKAVQYSISNKMRFEAKVKGLGDSICYNVTGGFCLELL